MGALAEFKERFVGWNAADIEDICECFSARPRPTPLLSRAPHPQTNPPTVTASTVVVRCS